MNHLAAGETRITIADPNPKGDGEALARWFGDGIMNASGEVTTIRLDTLMQPKTTKGERAMLRPARIDAHRVRQLKLDMQPSFNENAYGATASFALDSRVITGLEMLHVDDASYKGLPSIGGIAIRSAAEDQDEDREVDADDE